jgi:hypothetical protein
VHSYVSQVRDIENTLAQKTQMYGEDFLSSAEALQLQNKLATLMATGPNELQRQMEIRKANDTWLDENQAKDSWTTSADGNSYYILNDKGLIEEKSILQIAKDPELQARMLSNQDIQSLITSRNTPGNLMFNTTLKNKVLNSIGFEKAFDNLMDVYDQIEGSKEWGETRIKAMTNREVMRDVAGKLEEAPMILTKDIKTNSNLDKVHSVASDILAGRALGNSTRNAIKQRAIDNMLKIHDWSKDYEVTDKDENGKEVTKTITFGEAVDAEMKRILIMGMAMKKNVSSVTKDNLKAIPTGRGKSGYG